MTRFVAFAAVACLIGSAACSSSASLPTEPSAASTSVGRLSGRSSLPTIAGIAVANPDFSTLVAALQKAGLVETFDGDRHFTVFAPTNAAFDAAAVALLGAGTTGLDLVNGLDVPTLTAVLTYHVTRGDRNARSVLASATLRMLDGNTADVAVVNGTATIDGVPIEATDIRASNGIVHVVSGVLLPPSLP